MAQKSGDSVMVLIIYSHFDVNAAGVVPCGDRETSLHILCSIGWRTTSTFKVLYYSKSRDFGSRHYIIYVKRTLNANHQLEIKVVAFG